MRYVVLSLIIAAGYLTPAAAHGKSWVFQRSYYSHSKANPVQIGPQTRTGPVYTPAQGAYIRSGYRYLNSRITTGGGVVDQINAWESWIQTGEQY